MMVKARGTRESLGVSGVKACGGWGQRGSKHVDTGVAGGQIMVKSMWNGSHWGSAGVKACSGCQRGSNHVDTGVAGGQRGSNHVDTGVAGGQQGSNHVDTEIAGVQIMWTRESLAAGIKACGHGSRWG